MVEKGCTSAKRRMGGEVRAIGELSHNLSYRFHSETLLSDSVFYSFFFPFIFLPFSHPMFSPERGRNRSPMVQQSFKGSIADEKNGMAIGKFDN